MKTIHFGLTVTDTGYHKPHDYTIINNILYAVYKMHIGFKLYIFKNYIISDKYYIDGYDVLIKDNILYVLYRDRHKIKIYKYDLIMLKLIEINDVVTNNFVHVNINFNWKTYDLFHRMNNIMFSDKLYVISYIEHRDLNERKTNHICFVHDVEDQITYPILIDCKFINFHHHNKNIYIITFSHNVHVFNTETKKVTIEEIYDYGSKITSCEYFNDNHQVCNIGTGKAVRYDDERILYKNKFNIKNNTYFDYNKIYILTTATVSKFTTENLIKIGTSYIPFSVLKDRCKVVNMMMEDLSSDDTSFNNISFDNDLYKDTFEHIDQYLEYVKTSKITDSVKLFQIMDYLEDVDVEHVANYIAEKSENINDLELLYNSQYMFQFVYLLDRLLKIYECVFDNRLHGQTIDDEY